MGLGEIIKYFHELRNMSQTEMAFLTGMTITEIQHIELGLTAVIPDTPRLTIICEALDIPESCLLFLMAKDFGILNLGDNLEERIESLIIRLIEGSNGEDEDE